MAIRVALNDIEEGGQYAFLKDVNELNAGDRRAIRAAVPVTLGSDGKTIVYAGDHDDQSRNALLARIVTDWNLSYELPRGDPSVFDKLTIDQLDRLYAAVQPHVDFLSVAAVNPGKRGTDPTEGSSS
jgi:hypothetical protein